MENEAREMFLKTISPVNDFIFIKPVCDLFKIDTDNQTERIKKDPILARSAGKNRSEILFGDNHPRVCLDKKGFIRWIQIINPNIIPPNLRTDFLKYQELIFEFMFGAAAEQRLIGSLNEEIQSMQLEYSRLGNSIKNKRRLLTDLLNNRYQYQLPFEKQKMLNL